MGDAVASFLQRRDPATKDMCLLSIHEVRSRGYKAGAKTWEERQFRWKDVTSKKRRNMTLAMYDFLALVVDLPADDVLLHSFSFVWLIIMALMLCEYSIARTSTMGTFF